jgi:hypothetical protein
MELKDMVLDALDGVLKNITYSHRPRSGDPVHERDMRQAEAQRLAEKTAEVLKQSTTVSTAKAKTPMRFMKAADAQRHLAALRVKLGLPAPAHETANMKHLHTLIATAEGIAAGGKVGAFDAWRLIVGKPTSIPDKVKDHDSWVLAQEIASGKETAASAPSVPQVEATPKPATTKPSTVPAPSVQSPAAPARPSAKTVRAILSVSTRNAWYATPRGCIEDMSDAQAWAECERICYQMHVALPGSRSETALAQVYSRPAESRFTGAMRVSRANAREVVAKILAGKLR